MSIEQSKDSSHEAWVESLNTPESIQQNFLEAKDFIESSCGITLTNIELVGLRRISAEVMADVYRQEKAAGRRIEVTDSNFDHKTEILGRFMQYFYDINPKDINKLYKDLGEEKFQQFFKSKQAALHMP